MGTSHESQSNKVNRNGSSYCAYHVVERANSHSSHRGMSMPPYRTTTESGAAPRPAPVLSDFEPERPKLTRLVS